MHRKTKSTATVKLTDNNLDNIKEETFKNSAATTTIVNDESTPLIEPHQKEILSRNESQVDPSTDNTIQNTPIFPTPLRFDASIPNSQLGNEFKAPNKNNSEVITTNNITKIRTVDPIDFAALIRPSIQFSSQFHMLDNYTITPLYQTKVDIRKWEIGWTSSYFRANKTSSYSGSVNSGWFDSYKQSEKLHHSFSLGLFLNYNVSKNWFISGSLSYLSAQESHSFNTTESVSIYDENLIHTIIVDRDNNPIDTIFGTYRGETTTQENYLVTTIDLVGLGIGIGRSFDINSKWKVVSDIQLIPYLFQRSSGRIIDTNNNLIDQSEFSIDGTKVNLNNSVIGSQLNLAIRYRLSPTIQIGLSTSYRYHFGGFTDSTILPIKRNYLGVGFNVGYMF